MNILIPMAGEGNRFKEQGYNIPKPIIPTYDRKSKKEYPMVVCAANNLPGAEDKNNKIIFIDRTFHKEQGVEDIIKSYWENAKFITLDKLTEGQASTCLKAKDEINTDEELLIGPCDCGINININKFNELKKTCDCIVFTFTNNDSVCENPNAYGWMKTDSDNNILSASVKRAISDNPEKDPAVTAVFWFKHGKDFVQAAENMIAANKRINNEFYVDEVVNFILELGLKAKTFNVDKYFCWGTPKDYEDYQNTVKYWEDFLDSFKLQYNKDFFCGEE